MSPSSSLEKSPKVVLLRDVKAAERDYASAQSTWGDNNMVTQRAMAKWYEIRAAYNAQLKGKR